MVYINHHLEWASSISRLFADDCLLYGEINNQSDTETLQHDLGNLQHWDKTWFMEFAEKKCQILWITQKYKRNTIMRDYTIHGYSRQTKQEGGYLDVALQGRCQRYQLLDICKTVDMSWQYGTQLETRPANKNCKPVCKVRRWGLSTHQQHNSHQRTTLVGIPSRKESQSQSHYGL